ncbi:TPA: hypothetical protein JHW99_004277 [Escherichia coli]|nr:hypothetical protein [Escherichia coli]
MSYEPRSLPDPWFCEKPPTLATIQKEMNKCEYSLSTNQRNKLAIDLVNLPVSLNVQP